MAKLNEKEISLQSFDGAWLSGTLFYPRTPQAVVIPVHGSLCQDRDGNADESRHWMFGSPPPKRNLFKDIRENLSSMKIATFCFDKRASGKSEGIYAQTDLDTLAKDLVEVSRRVKDEYPELPQIYIGQSEGSLTIPRAMEFGLKPHAQVLQGPVVDAIRTLIEFQKDNAAKPFLEDKSGKLEKAMPFLAASFNTFYGPDFLEYLDRSDRHIMFESPSGYRAKVCLDLYRQYEMTLAREFVLKYKVPTLFMIGDKDLNCPAGQVRDLQSWVADRKEELQHVDIEILEGLEHSFRKAKEGESFMESMKKPIAPQYFKSLRVFLEKQLPSK